MSAAAYDVAMRIALVMITALALTACSKNEEKGTSTTTSAMAPTPPAPTTAATATQAPMASAAPAPEVSPEMKGFLAMLDGSNGGAKKALQKYGSKAVQSNDVGMYSLKDPKVTKSEKVGVMQCYTFEAAAGATKHETRTCWDSTGKIAQVTDKTL